MNSEYTITDLSVLWFILLFIILIWRAVLIKKIFEWPWFDLNRPASDMQFDFIFKLMIETYIIQDQNNDIYEREIKTYRILTTLYWILWVIMFIALLAGWIYYSVKGSK